MGATAILMLASCGVLEDLGVVPAPAIAITPSAATLSPGQTQMFTIEGAGETSLIWEAPWGTLESHGDSATYTAPHGLAGTVTLSARDESAPHRTATAHIAIEDDFSDELVMHANGRLARLKWDEFDYRQGPGYQYVNYPAPSDVSHVLYRHFDDAFDFIFLVFNADVNYIICRYHAVSNDVLGIGQEPFDNTSAFGSDGRLRGVLALGPSDLGPTHGTLANAWGNHIVDAGNRRGWGFSSANGQMGGFDRSTLEDLGEGIYRASATSPSGFQRASFGTFLNGGNSLPYSPIELYVMGLIPPEEVPPLLVAQEPEWVDAFTGTFRASGFVEYSIDDLISMHGERSPTYLSSPKAFRVLTVVVTYEPLTEAGWRHFDEQVRWLSYPGEASPRGNNFWRATGGRATLKMDDLFSALSGD